MCVHASNCHGFSYQKMFASQAGGGGVGQDGRYRIERGVCEPGTQRTGLIALPLVVESEMPVEGHETFRFEQADWFRIRVQ